MVLEKYGPPIVRKTRHMVQKQTGPSHKKSVSPKDKQLGLMSSPSQQGNNSANEDNEVGLDHQLRMTKETVGLNNRPLLLVKQL